MPCGFVTCGPNSALVVSGMFHSKPKLVAGGRVFVLPCCQQVQELSLKIMTLSIASETVYSSQGVPVTVAGVAQVKIQGENKDMLLIACEQFLGKKNVKEIERVAQQTLEGHQRAIIGSMTVEEIYKDRKKFSKQVYEVASADLKNMGITVISYTIRDVRDERGYLQALGMGRTAEVQRDARVGEAEANRDSQIKAAQAEQDRMDSKYKNDTLIAQAKRDFELKKAAYDAEVNTKDAEAKMAFQLQSAITQQSIRAEQMQILVVERMQEIELADQEVERKRKQLDAEVKKPAEAEKFRLEKIAEANQKRVVLEAEADAEAIRLRGQAEADAAAAKGKAEAEMLEMKADAYRHYKDAAIIEMLLEALPKVAAEVAAPLSQVQSLRMVSTGGEIGPARLTTEVLETILRVPQLVSTVTGFDITKSLNK